MRRGCDAIGDDPDGCHEDEGSCDAQPDRVAQEFAPALGGLHGELVELAAGGECEVDVVLERAFGRSAAGRPGSDLKGFFFLRSGVDGGVEVATDGGADALLVGAEAAEQTDAEPVRHDAVAKPGQGGEAVEDGFAFGGGDKDGGEGRGDVPGDLGVDGGCLEQEVAVG